MGSAPSKDRMKIAKTRFHESQPVHEKPPPPYELHVNRPTNLLGSNCQPIIKQDVAQKIKEIDNTNHTPPKGLTSPWRTLEHFDRERTRIRFMYQVLDHKNGCKTEQ